jgi:hypothetical protein
MATRSAPAFDQQALVSMIADAGAKQAEQVRQAVYDATLQALQGRELTMQNIRGVLKNVSKAASTGAAQSTMPATDVEAVLEGAVQGMDDALLRAVEAYRVGAGKMIDQGLGMQDQVMQKAVDAVEKMEDALFKALQQAADGAQGQLGKPWAAVLEKFQVGGTGTGAKATAAVEQMTAQMQQMQQAMRDSRAASMRAASVLAQNWGALVSGVLIGMSDAMKQGGGKGAVKAKK